MTLPASTCQVAFARTINPLNPDPKDIEIRGIAAALSKQCRFGGHVNQLYFVADHSVRVSYVVPEKHAFSALMHDVSEYILCDFPSPIKNDIFGATYREAEDRIMNIMAEKYGFEWPVPKEVKYADNVLLATEIRDLLDPLPPQEFDELWSPWLFTEPLEQKIIPLTHDESYKIFLHRFYELGGKDG